MLTENKVVITVTSHIGEKVDGHFFLRAVNQNDCREIKSPYILQFEKNTESFLETMSIIKDKMIRIKEILDE
jgi:hypothetical protein